MNYKKAYSILLKEISDTIDILENIKPKTFEIYLAIRKLQTSLLDAEKMYLETAEKIS